MEKRYKLIIFDLDGTLTTTKSGAKFRKSEGDWQLLLGREEKLHELDTQGVKLAIATNQGGVAYGLLDYHAMRREIAAVAEALHIPYVAMCFTHPKATLPEFREDSLRRKPQPGMLLEAIQSSGEQAKDTLMVGDRDEDQQAAWAAQVDFQWTSTFFEGGLPI